MFDDATIYNLKSSKPGKFLCPVCGFDGAFDSETFTKSGGLPGMGICCCCMFEPGYDDRENLGGEFPTVAQNIKHFQNKWISGGMKWICLRDDHLKPIPWDPKIQLDSLFLHFPFLKES